MYIILKTTFLSVSILALSRHVILKTAFSFCLNSSIIQANGGSPPLTYAMFCQVTEIVGLPPQPCPNPDFSNVKLHLPEDNKQFSLPTCEELGEVLTYK